MWSFPLLPLPIWVFFPLAFLIRGAVYNRYIHPLSKIPGPFLASLTSLWLAWQGFNQRRPRLDLALHRKYGPVVRISPDEIIFANPDYLKPVYGAGTKFTKGRFYEAPTDRSQPQNWERLDMLTELNVEKLRVQKRFAGPVYSTGNVVRHEGKIDANIRRFGRRLDGLVEGEAVVDVYREWELLNTDVMTELTFAKEFGAVEAGSDQGHMAGMDKMWEWWGFVGYLPLLNWIDKEYAPWRIIFSGTSIHLPVFPFCVGKIMEYDQLATSKTHDPKPCLLDDLRQLTKDRPEFLANWGTHLAITDLGAGVDTMSWTLATITVGIAQNPRILKKVQAELDAANLNKTEPVPYDAAAQLEYLQACMHEAMRLWPNVAISLPRIVPKGGIDIDGYHIPEGCTVGMNSRVLGLNEEIFGPEPEIFRPERWLEADKARRNEMETRNLAFGGASRRCPGLHLAWVCMSKVMASFHLNYEMEILNTMDGPPGPGGHVWTERGSFPTKWHGLEVKIVRR